jgi:type IV secretion system protein VirB11
MNHNQIDTVLGGYIKPLKKYLDKKDIVEICCNREHELVIENTRGQWEYHKDAKITRTLFENIGSYLANKTSQRFDTKTPTFSGTLPGYGYRLQICTGAMVGTGIAVSIRVSQASSYPLESYMSQEEADKLTRYVKEGKTLLICAATGCGKTTLLNSLIPYIPEDARIISLQDTPELVIPHRNHVSLMKSKTDTDIAGLKYKHYMNAITRLYPTRVLLGEIDTDNVLAFLKLVNTGHSGSISTIHAENAHEAVNSLCINVQMSGETNATVESIREFALKAVDFFVVLTKEQTPQGRVFKATIVSRDDVRKGVTDEL